MSPEVSPEQRDLRIDLRTVMRPWRYVGLLLVLSGAGVLLFARSDQGLAQSGWASPMAYALLVLGWVVLIFVVVVRTRRRARLMRDEGRGPL